MSAPVVSRRRALAIFGAGALAGCGGGVAGSSTAAAPAAEPRALPAPVRALPATWHLFGPVQKQAALGADGEPLPSIWHFPGSALTANTCLVRFDLDVPPIAWAIWRMVWMTKSTVLRARLVHFDDGPNNIVQLGEPIEGSGRGAPDNHPIDITAALNALRGGPYKNIGMQLYGDAINQYAVYASRIELAWELP